MIKIIVDKLIRIVKSRKKLEKILEVKITNRGREVYIEGNPEDEYIAEKVIDAIDFGFPLQAALEIKTQDFIYERISIKDHTKQVNRERVRGRIIGTGGKTLQTLSNISGCYLERNGNEVGIIGDPEQIAAAQQAIISIIHGAKQGNAYSYLERTRPKPIDDLGLREKETK